MTVAADATAMVGEIAQTGATAAAATARAGMTAWAGDPGTVNATAAPGPGTDPASVDHRPNRRHAPRGP